MNRSEKSGEPGWLPFIGAAVFAIGTWIIYLLYVPDQFDDWTKRGQFGDMFGALNALFSAIAFAALVYTMILQKAELRLQRLELEETRSEIRGQRLQLEAQTKTFAIQAFESTFFHLVDLHHKIVDGTDKRTASGDLIGRDCFSRIYNEFANHLIGSIQKLAGVLDADLVNKNNRQRVDIAIEKMQNTYKDATKPAWEAIYAKYMTDLAHYFRNLYHIVKFVDSQLGLTEDEKYGYVRLLRAQLSSGELALLFQNGLSGKGQKFKPLIEKFALLKNLDDELLYSSSAKVSYSPKAFGIEEQ